MASCYFFTSLPTTPFFPLAFSGAVLPSHPKHQQPNSGVHCCSSNLPTLVCKDCARQTLAFLYSVIPVRLHSFNTCFSWCNLETMKFQQQWVDKYVLLVGLNIFHSSRKVTKRKVSLQKHVKWLRDFSEVAGSFFKLDVISNVVNSNMDQ